MQLKPEEFEAHLKRQLLPAYLLFGDEPLILQECADQLRAACRRQGFTERKVFTAEAQFDWRELGAEFGNLSLFGDRKLVEVRLPSGKPGKEGGAALQQLLASPSPDNVLLLLAGKLDRDASRAAWFRDFERSGATLRVWPMKRRDLPRWIGQRLQAAGFRASGDALALLAERVEGNLLAAAQEVEKLALLADPGPLDAPTLAALVTDSARFSTFDLCDRALEGDRAATLRTLAGLRAEGTDATLVLWAIAEELRRIGRLAQRRNAGESMQEALRGAQIFAKPHYERAILRLGRDGIHRLLRQAAEVDRCIKGLEHRDEWQLLEDLVLLACRFAAGERVA